VTRMSDNDPNNKKEYKLDLDTQLEKLPLGGLEHLVLLRC